MSAEAQGVAHGIADVRLAALIGDHVQSTFRVGGAVVDGGGKVTVPEAQSGENSLHGSGSAQHFHGLDEAEGVALFHPVACLDEGGLLRSGGGVEGAHQRRRHGAALRRRSGRGGRRVRDCGGRGSYGRGRSRSGYTAPAQFYGKFLGGQLHGVDAAALKAVHQVKNFLIGHGNSFHDGKLARRRGQKHPSGGMEKQSVCR